MNKKMIAAAVAMGLTAPMIAQAEPTAYGRVQVEYASIDYGTGSANSDKTDLIDQNMGRIGLKGSHDLGNGLSALYKAEFGLHTDDNVRGSTADGTSLVDRDTYVGLKGNFGEVILGNISSPYKDSNLDPFNATLHEARSNRAQSSGAFGHHGFVEKAVKYTNKFGPVKFSALMGLYSDDDDTADTQGEGGISLAATYTGGPLTVVAGHSSESSDVTGNEDVTRSKLAAKFKTGPWAFTGQYETVEGWNNATGAAGERDLMYVAGEFNMGKNTIYARIGERDQEVGSANDNEHMALVLRHKMSKTTRAWVGYSSDDSDTNSDDEDRLTVGMRIDF